MQKTSTTTGNGRPLTPCALVGVNECPFFRRSVKLLSGPTNYSCFVLTFSDFVSYYEWLKRCGECQRDSQPDIDKHVTCPCVFIDGKYIGGHQELLGVLRD